jgi:hypothetical protein
MVKNHGKKTKENQNLKICNGSNNILFDNSIVGRGKFEP